jgi:mono/diheme cytochrome c family protein
MLLCIVFATVFLFLLTACGNSAEPETAVPTSPPLTEEQARGRKVFETNCGACHSILADTVIVGPSLHGIAARADTQNPKQDGRTYLYTAILKPGDFLVDGYDNLMPATFGKQLTGEELDAVVAYLMTLE